MKHNVHIFPVVQVKVEDVEADSHEQAIELAQEQVDLYRLFERAKPHQEYAEEISHFLVDEVGDDEYERSEWYDADGKPFPAIVVHEPGEADAPELLAALESLVLAVASREATMGDPIDLLDAKRELREAADVARAAIEKARRNGHETD